MLRVFIPVVLAVAAFGVGGFGIARAQSIMPDVITPSPDVVYFANVNAAPFKWAGRLEFPNPAQQGYVTLCTAQFITENVLLTAGHCLRDLPSYPAGPWPDPSQGAFFLQYNNGQYSQKFNIVCGLTNPLWAYPANYNSLTPAQKQAAQNAAWPHDFALLLVNGTSSTGAIPYALDLKGPFSSVWRIGYPEDVIGGDTMVWTPGIVFPANAIPLPIGDNSANLLVQWGAMTDATEGMSGGAWAAPITDVQTGNTSFTLIAVTSFNVNLLTNNQSAEAPAYPGAAWAAYLASAEFNPLLQRVQNGCK